MSDPTPLDDDDPFALDPALIGTEWQSGPGVGPVVAWLIVFAGVVAVIVFAVWGTRPH
jgi:hypothetical protein